MSFTLLDNSSENFEFTSNVWNWKTALDLVKGLDIVSEGLVRQMGYNAMGVTVGIDDAHAIGEAVKSKILPKLGAGKRIYADGTVTDAPDDMTLHRDGDDQWKNYSVTYEWLQEFSDFCLRSKGFKVY